MQQPTFSPSWADQFAKAFRRITSANAHLNAHLNTELEQLFQSLNPSANDAALLRHRLFQALRYNDVNGAWEGAWDYVVDPSRAYRPSWCTLPADDDAWLRDAPVFVRVNTLRTSVDECFRALAPFQPMHLHHECIRLDAPFGMFKSTAFSNGWFEQQDLNSQRVGQTISEQVFQKYQPKYVVDLCAGTGGKTLHLSACLKNRGRIIALDIHEGKLETLRRRATRAGATNIETRHISSTKVVKRLAGKADLVLVDAPCSGSGVIRRKPDILYHQHQASVDELVSTQRQLLHRAASICKPNGYVAYVTCSLLDQECTEQRNYMLAECQSTLIDEWRTTIGQDNGDGFYFALFRTPATVPAD